MSGGYHETTYTMRDSPYHECQTCFVTVRTVNNPVQAAEKAKSSQQMADGIIMGCDHIFCLECITSYLHVKLNGPNGPENWPIVCPGVILACWLDQFTASL